MRTFLLIGLAAVTLSLSGFAASGATSAEFARNSGVEPIAFMQPVAAQASESGASYIRDSIPAMAIAPRENKVASVAGAIGTIIALAGAGLVFTLTAVGLRHVWTQDPIHDPLSDGPGFL